MSLSAIHNSFISLVRLGIGHSCNTQLLSIEWTDVKAIATCQGLSAIVLDGVEGLSREQCPPQAFLLSWIGEVLNCYENNYSQYEKRIGQLAHFYNSHDYRMMVIKGYGLSLNYPKPSHRPCGDIDIWLFGHQKEADALLRQEKGIKVDTSHHHHSVFQFEGYTVENHFDWVNIYGHKSGAELERIFKELAQDDSNWVDVNGEKVYLPSANLHALFLLRHTMLHFTSTSMTLRQILDWAFFVKRHRDEIDWVWLVSVLERYNMKDFYNCINAICVEDLGFESGLFGEAQFSLGLKERVLMDTLSPEFTEGSRLYI